MSMLTHSSALLRSQLWRDEIADRPYRLEVLEHNVVGPDLDAEMFLKEIDENKDSQRVDDAFVEQVHVGRQREVWCFDHEFTPNVVGDCGFDFSHGRPLSCRQVRVKRRRS